MTTIGKLLPVRACAFARSVLKRFKRPFTSPLSIECLDILSPLPGDSEVITHLPRDSSRETKIAARVTSMAARATPDSIADIVVSRMLAGGQYRAQPPPLSTGP